MKTSPHKDGLKLTLTKDDFDFEFFTAGGHGGQNVQKTSTACRCTHRPSKSVGISRDERSQPQNKKAAFERCANTESFKQWCKIELARQEQRLLDNAPEPIEARVERDMQPHNLRVEVKDDQGNWTLAPI